MCWERNFDSVAMVVVDVAVMSKGYSTKRRVHKNRKKKICFEICLLALDRSISSHRGRSDDDCGEIRGKGET